MWILCEMDHMKPSGANHYPPPKPKKVAEEPAYFSVTLKTPTEALRADSNDMTSLKEQVKKVMLITPTIAR